MYNVEILADSKRAGSKHRITSMKVTFPRYLLAEFNTHRMFSRNSASSRAIPTKKMLKMIMEKVQRNHTMVLIKTKMPKTEFLFLTITKAIITALEMSKKESFLLLENWKSVKTLDNARNWVEFVFSCHKSINDNNDNDGGCNHFPFLFWIATCNTTTTTVKKEACWEIRKKPPSPHPYPHLLPPFYNLQFWFSQPCQSP